MYDMVADVAKYPEYLPWCIAVRLRDQSANHIVADLIIGWKVIRESFTSHVHLHPHDLITVEYKDGPFRYLHNEWRFTPVGKNKTRIDFMVDFEFRSHVMETIIGPLFNPAVKSMIHAFEKRAKELYAD